MYRVIDKAGNAFGPATLETLRQWAIDRRLTPDMTVVDQTTGQQGEAAEMLLGLAVFLDPIPPDTQHGPTIQPVSYAYKGSTEPGEPPMLQTRAAAYFIDVILAVMVYMALRYGLWDLLLPRSNYAAWTLYGYIDYFCVPATALLLVLRDAVFPGQSIGKRIAGLKVVATNAAPPTPVHSIIRNVSAAPLALIPLPWIGYVGLVALLGWFGVDCFLVMTQGKRLADRFAFTTVVNA